MSTFRYTQCGLDNVEIHGLPPMVDDSGEKVYEIPNVNGLHKAIAKSIVDRPAGMTGKELRFLRTEMGMTQAELASVLQRDAQSIGRWERGEVAIDQTAELVVRMLVVQNLNLDMSPAVADLAKKCVPSATYPMGIDLLKTDENTYEKFAA